jgi:hypothetical protein
LPPVTAVAAGTDAEVAAVAAATGVPHAGAGMAVAVAAVEVAAMAVVVAAAAVAVACGSRASGFARRVDASRERPTAGRHRRRKRVCRGSDKCDNIFLSRDYLPSPAGSAPLRPIKNFKRGPHRTGPAMYSGALSGFRPLYAGITTIMFKKACPHHHANLCPGAHPELIDVAYSISALRPLNRYRARM